MDPYPGMRDQAPRPADIAALRLKHDHRTLKINVALTSAPGREDSVNEQFGRMSRLVTPVTAVADLIFSPPGNQIRYSKETYFRFSR
jgi:hypothetical protein